VTEVNAATLAMNLNATSDTSASSVAIGTGAKTFTVTAGKSFLGGMFLVIADTAAPSTNWMSGQVTSYSGTSLVMNILAVGGSGTKTAWTISQSATGVAGGAVVAGAGANADITSLTGLTSAIPSLNTVAKLQPVDGTVSGSALTVKINPTTIDMRSSTLSSATINSRVVAAQITMTVSNGSSLGFIASQAGRIAVLAIDNAGTVEVACCNAYGGANLDEGTLITTVAEGGAGAADSAATIYSTTARSNVPFKIMGYLDITPGASFAWTAAPTTIQGAGSRNSLIKNSTCVRYAAQSTASGTAWDFSSIPPWATRIEIPFIGFSTNGTSVPILQIGDAGGLEVSGYTGAVEAGGTSVTLGAGFAMDRAHAAASINSGTFILTLGDALTNSWSCIWNCGRSDVAGNSNGGGYKALTQPLDRVRLTMTNGTDAGDAGSVSCIVY
jgi:hypothetical protein